MTPVYKWGSGTQRACIVNLSTCLIFNLSFLGSEIFLTLTAGYRVLVLAWLVYFCSWITALNSRNELPHCSLANKPSWQHSQLLFPVFRDHTAGKCFKSCLECCVCSSVQKCGCHSRERRRWRGCSVVCGSPQVLEDLCIRMSLEPLFCVVKPGRFWSQRTARSEFLSLLGPWGWQFMSAFSICLTSSPKLLIVSLGRPV